MISVFFREGKAELRRMAAPFLSGESLFADHPGLRLCRFSGIRPVVHAQRVQEGLVFVQASLEIGYPYLSIPKKEKEKLDHLVCILEKELQAKEKERTW